MIQAFRREAFRKERFEKMNKEYYDAQNKMLRLNSLMSHNLTWVLRISAPAMIIGAAAGGMTGSLGSVLSLGALYAFVDYVTRLFEPLNNIVNQLSNLEQARVSGERVFKLMDEPGVDVQDDEVSRFKRGGCV